MGGKFSDEKLFNTGYIEYVERAWFANKIKPLLKILKDRMGILLVDDEKSILPLWRYPNSSKLKKLIRETNVEAKKL
ncbi:hypothetical protein ELD05_09780 [Caldicellulosiruptor changbaiensis]|uniref:Uncharacterized protein n=1 Tax=Caldicellulosiruptor changbaiensis TaxID=1222016 RepID=A0A3T0D7A1_9FIRM|nr:hypothetical protein [Caldicellulosiruptor changbaiensis]AZT90908.1 hypothetical protein ELD05_09780 [Caldicellulosiruptor changbaiensis]